MEIGGEGWVGRVAVPASGRGRGVVVLPPASGLPDAGVSACERMAREGFVALAPDVAPPEPGGDPGAARRIVLAAIEQLFREPETEGERVGALGLGGGFGLALDAGTQDPRVAVVVGFGGTPLHDSFQPARLAGPVLALFGEKDEAVVEGRLESFERQLREAGVNCDLRVQPGVAAGFYDERLADLYDPVAAEAAWDAALARLRAELS